MLGMRTVPIRSPTNQPTNQPTNRPTTNQKPRDGAAKKQQQQPNDKKQQYPFKKRTNKNKVDRAKPGKKGAGRPFLYHTGREKGPSRQKPARPGEKKKRTKLQKPAKTNKHQQKHTLKKTKTKKNGPPRVLLGFLREGLVLLPVRVEDLPRRGLVHVDLVGAHHLELRKPAGGGGCGGGVMGHGRRFVGGLRGFPGLHMCIYIYMCTYTCTYMYICVHTYIYIYICGSIG